MVNYVPSVLLILCVLDKALIDFISADGTILTRFSRGAAKNSVTPEEVEQIISSHNEYRAKVSPPAADMQKMSYDAGLASMAQEWADGCKYEHGNPVRETPPFPAIGQNLYAGTSNYDPAAFTKAWYDEEQDYTYSNGNCTAVCGHYTQVVWADTYAVGCGIAYCSPLTTWTEGYLVVCNYGPAGNYKGEKPYQEGSACSACPDGNTCDFDLCVDPSRSSNGTSSGGMSTNSTDTQEDQDGGTGTGILDILGSGSSGLFSTVGISLTAVVAVTMTLLRILDLPSN